MALHKTSPASRARDLDKIEEICLSKEALHDKLSRLARHTDRCARSNDEAVVWKARYASLILLLRDRERWWHPTPNWPECQEALKGVWGEAQFDAVSPTLESVFWLAEMAGRVPPVHDRTDTEGPVVLKETVQHCLMRRHGAALRALLDLPDDRGRQEPRPVLIVLSSKGAWRPTRARVAQWGAALPEPEALAATHLAVALAAAYPDRNISVLPAETRRPELEPSEYEDVKIDDFDECYRESHTFVLGAEYSNCLANLIRRRMRDAMPAEKLFPWPDEEQIGVTPDGKPVRHFGVRLAPGAEIQVSEMPDETRRGRDRGCQHLRYEGLLGEGVMTNLLAGPFAAGTAGAALALTEPSYVAAWLREQTGADKPSGPCRRVADVVAGPFNPWPMDLGVFWRE